MLRVLSVIASVALSTVATAETLPPTPNQHALSEAIVAKGAELCPKINTDKKKERCEQVFGHLSLSATATEVRAGLYSSSALRSKEIESDLAKTKALYERAIETYSR